MPKVRLGVALLLPPPLTHEVDGLRRALNDGSLGRIPAHLTLVPPVNINQERLAGALKVLRDAAQATRPLHVMTGPPATFLPDNPVLYLPVEEGEAAVTALRNRVFREPLARSLTWPFVAHVTLADEAPPDRIAAAQVALADYRLETIFDTVHLLEQGKGRIWRPIAEARFEEPAVIGRGGLPVELSVTTILDPEAAVIAGLSGFANEPGKLVITARRDDDVLGVLIGSTEVEHLMVVPRARGEGIEGHLVAAFRWRRPQ